MSTMGSDITERPLDEPVAVIGPAWWPSSGQAAFVVAHALVIDPGQTV